MPRVNIEGTRHVTNRRTERMMDEAERIGGNLVVTQGSYSTAVGASAGTHDGGGVLDFSVRGLSMRQINRRVRALRRVGFAAWYRPALPGVWGPHIHAVAIGTKDLAPIAARQVTAYKLGRDGLRGNGLDRHRGLNVSATTWERYKRERDAA